MEREANTLASRYRLAHNEMRSIDGLQPSDALDELLKYLLFRIRDEAHATPVPKIDVFTDASDISNIVESIRNRFCSYLKSERSSTVSMFFRDRFHLSDTCIAQVHEILGPTSFTSYSFDIRSAALRSFLGPELRKGLGIFLTPDEVAHEIVNFFSFIDNDSIADPACGSGTFLMCAAKCAISQSKNVTLYGIDKSPRMLLLADLNIGCDSRFLYKSTVADSLRPGEYNGMLPNRGVDYIVTNPPFGVTVDSRSYELDRYITAVAGNGGYGKRQPSELLFLEQCLSLLKPGGWLAIVLPKSAVNTMSGERACVGLAEIGAVRAIVTLPPETFSATGTMTNTLVLFIQKFGDSIEPCDTIEPVISRITNVGFDSTGRTRSGNQLPGLGEALRASVLYGEHDDRIARLKTIRAQDTFPHLMPLLKGRASASSRHTIPLRDLVTCISTGATPARNAYTDQGMFLVKVGNLTGTGISWIPRDRNFIDQDSAPRRYQKPHMRLQDGDILLTSSAHSPKYIAKKIDIVADLPEWIGRVASYVGEIMLIRPDPERVDPYALLAYLRLPFVVVSIQDMIRGQTAHLHSEDVLSLPIDMDILEKDLHRLRELAKEEAELNMQLNKNIKSQIDAAMRLSQ